MALKTLLIRIEEDLKKQIEEKAKKEGISLSEYIRRRLREKDIEKLKTVSAINEMFIEIDNAGLSGKCKKEVKEIIKKNLLK